MYIGNDLQVAYPSYKIIDDISSSFNGSNTSFALQVGGSTPVPFPINTQQVMISVNGVIQEPDPTGSAGFKLQGSNIVFSSAPANGHAFFGVINAGADYVSAGADFPNGTVGSPSLTFTNDLDTGFYRVGSGSVGFSSNGVLTSNFDGNGLTITGTCTATTFSGNGASITHLDLADATNTGTIPVARLGSGATSSKFLRGDNSWQTVSGTTINTNADNRLITGSGTANTLNGESTLTYDGSSLNLASNSSSYSNFALDISGSHDAKIVLQGSTHPYIYFREGTTDKALIQWEGNYGALYIQNNEENAALRIKDDIDFSTDTSGTPTWYSILHQNNVGSGGKLASTNVYVNEIHGSGANLTSLNASNISSGTIAAARVPTLNQNSTGSSGSCTGNAATATNASGLTGSPSITCTNVSDSKGNVRTIVQNSQSTYTLVAADAGKHILATGTITIPTGVLSTGDAVTIVNSSSSNITLTASVNTLYNTADATTGNRTLAARGMATILFTSTNTAYISGAGLS